MRSRGLLSVALCCLFHCQTTPKLDAPPWATLEVNRLAEIYGAHLVIAQPFEQLALEGKDPFTMGPASAPADQTPAEAMEELFHWVCDSMQVWDAPDQVPFGDLVYGFGYGLCGHQARWLGELAVSSGHKARLVSLPSHRMVEIWLEGHYELFDPQHQTHFKNLMGHSCSLSSLQREGRFPEGLDAIGYAWSYMEGVLTEDTPRYRRCKRPPQAPVLSLGAGQVLLLGRRPSGQEDPLPEQEPLKSPGRRDVLHYWLLHVIEKSGAAPRPFSVSVGLPLLGVDFSSGDFLSLQLEERTVPQNQLNGGDLPKEIFGKSQTISGVLAPGRQVHWQFALANWVAMDWLSAKDFTAMEKGKPPRVLAVTRFDRADRVWLKAMGVPPGHTLRLGDTVTLEAMLAWEGLHWPGRRTLKLVLDELSSDLDLECWQTMDTSEVVLDPSVEGPQGEKAVSLTWVVLNRAFPYRSQEWRTLAARLSGPGIPAGMPSAKLRVRLDTR
jgi:hypothetical protein